MAQLIKVDGTITEVSPLNGKKFMLEELQKYVGGYIETASTVEKGFIMIVNEDSKVGDGKHELNRVATGKYLYAAHAQIVGDVVILSAKEWKQCQ